MVGQSLKLDLVWYAKEKGWDAEAGLDIQMQLFDSGQLIS